MRHPDYVQETATAVFQGAEMLPLATFCRRSGMGRQAVLHQVSEGILHVIGYRTGKRRKVMVTRTSYMHLLRQADIRRAVR